MRHFGNAHYGGWYKSNKSSHQRYYSFLGQLREAFDARGLYRKRDAVSDMRLNLNKGKTPEKAQKASKTPGYSPPLYSDFNSMWEESQDTPAIVEYFADGGVAPTDGSGEGALSNMQEMLLNVNTLGMKPGATRMTREEFVAKVQSYGPGGGTSGDLYDESTTPTDDEILAAALAQEEDESFFSQYKTPIVLGSALVLAGGAYYFFVVRD